MHTPMARLSPTLLAALVLTLPLAGCGSDAAKPGTGVEVGNTVNYGSFGTTVDIDCGQGKSLNVAGSNNTLTVTGSCASVNVGGADNKIVFDKIDDDLSVVGLNNTVTYKSGDPTVDNLGSGNTIHKG